MYEYLKLSRRFLFLIVVMLAVIFSTANFETNALTLNTVDGIWQNAQRAPGLPAFTCIRYANTPDPTDENIITSGVGAFVSVCPAQADVTSQSGFGFQGVQSVEFEPGQPFLLGEFTHYNNPVWLSDGNMSRVELAITLDFSEPDFTTSLTYTLLLDETSNTAGTCLYPSVTPCADKVTFQNTIPDQEFELDGVTYTLNIFGFRPGDT